MTKVVSLDHRPKLFKVLVYGEFGAGKTYLAGTASLRKEMSPVLFGNVEGGELTIRNNANMKQTERLTSFREVEELVNSIHNGAKEFSAFNTLVIDSITAVRDILAEELMARPGRKLDMVTMQEWGIINISIKRFCRSLVNLPINVIATALPRFYYPKSKEENPTVDPVEVCPDFSRKLSNSICAMFDSVWYLYDDNGTRHLLTSRQDPYVAKTRGASFAQAIRQDVKNPSFMKLFDELIKSGK